MRTSGVLKAILLIAATAGAARGEVLQVTGEFPAANREASFLRSVSVDRIGGTDGPALAIAIERALTNSQLEVVGGRFGRDTAEGAISGVVSTGVDLRPYTRKEKRCAEKAADGKCVKEEEVEIACTRRVIDMNADLRIVRNTDGKILYSEGQPFHDETTWCERAGPDRSVDAIVAGAIGGMARSLRDALVPHIDTYQVRVRENTKGLAKETAQRFKDLVKLTKRDARGACAGWEALRSEAMDHPSLIFNLGVCAEQRGDYQSAVTLYTDAARAGAAEGNEGAQRATRLIAGREDAEERARRRR